jgi:hypothetical protein
MNTARFILDFLMMLSFSPMLGVLIWILVDAVANAFDSVKLQ